jgi:hypothetical protein
VLIFKYVSPDAVPKVFEDAKELSIRFGLPKNYNDPYELFLKPDPPLEAEEQRAFYDYFLGKVAEAPVACFSRRPDSVVMWAHYAKEAAGICLSFDEDTVVDQLPIAYVGNIEYADGPATISATIVEYAYATGKRRHTLRLIEVAHRAAYFTKRADWQYEAERRIVVTPDAVENRNGVLLGRVSPRALRHIILGPRVALDVKELCRARAQQWGVSLIELRIGARTFVPFFTSPDMGATTWSGTDFQRVANVCGGCGEPAELSESGKCQWCSITEEVKNSAPKRSLLTLSLSLGIDKGLPLAFDGIKPRGRSVTESKPENLE